MAPLPLPLPLKKKTSKIEECHSLVMSVDRKLDAVIWNKWNASKYEVAQFLSQSALQSGLPPKVPSLFNTIRCKAWAVKAKIRIYYIILFTSNPIVVSVPILLEGPLCAFRTPCRLLSVDPCCSTTCCICDFRTQVCLHCENVLPFMIERISPWSLPDPSHNITLWH